MIGPGKYDAEATALIEKYAASGIVLAILSPNGKSGFSVQGTGVALLAVPRLLRDIADELEKDVASMGVNDG
jgi:citrate lyase alpha subunit